VSTDGRDAAINSAFRAALMVIGDEKLQQRLRDPDQSASAMEVVGLPQSAQAGLLNLLNRLEVARRAGSVETEAAAADARGDEIRNTLLESYVHIRWSFWTLFGMSVVLFLVGLVFLGVAMARSLDEGSVSSATLTIAGLGVADLVVLFYSRPWQDIARNLSSSQQARIIATSYLASLALVQQGRAQELRLLERLTHESVALLGPQDSTTVDEALTPEEKASEGPET
jgi:hypothetical protein